MSSARVDGSAACLLVLNGGSSSLKFALLDVRADGVSPLLTGEIARIGEARGTMHMALAQGQAPVHHSVGVPHHRAALLLVLAGLKAANMPAPQAVAHRVVQGGPRVREHTVIDANVLTRLRQAIQLAPLHAPAALTLIEDCMVQFPALMQVACLDTAFHAGLPAIARTLPLPSELRSAGIERYGFHGLSCESIVHQLADALPRRLVIAHLGQGASITAVLKGRSIDTSMGLTPSGGVMMGTRSGDLDPGVLLHLMREMTLKPAEIENLLIRRSGLLGVSGISADLRDVRAAAATHDDAQLAIDLFSYGVAKTIGAMAVALGGIDGLVFTGGIGEHDAELRHDVCARLACLGLAVDGVANRGGQGVISRGGASCRIQVLSEEELQMARDTWAVLNHPDHVRWRTDET